MRNKEETISDARMVTKLTTIVTSQAYHHYQPHTELYPFIP